MQLYQNHVVYQSFSDLFHVEVEEQRKLERRRQALVAIKAAAKVKGVEEQYNALRAQRGPLESDSFFQKLTTDGSKVGSARTQRALNVHFQDEAEDDEDEDERPTSIFDSDDESSSDASSAPSTPETSRPPSLLHDDAYEKTPRRRESSDSCETADTSLHSSCAKTSSRAAHESPSKHVRFSWGMDTDDESLSYPAALHASNVARRLQRKESDIITLEDQPGVAGRLADDSQDLGLRRF